MSKSSYSLNCQAPNWNDSFVVPGTGPGRGCLSLNWNRLDLLKMDQE